MRRLISIAPLLAIAALGPAGCQQMAALPADPVGPRRLGDIELLPDSRLITGVIPSGITLGGMLSGYQIPDEERLALVSAVEPVFDVRRVRVGQPFVLDRMLDGQVRRFEYEIDGDRRLVVRPSDTSAENGDSGSDRTLVATLEPIEKTTTIAAVEGEIDRDHPSLTQALDAVGERLDLALQMADIFSGELDFSSELQPGDRFRLVVERYTREDTFAGYGAILAAEFVASDRPLQAFRFATETGKAAYYDEHGRSLKRFFLKSPLKFEPRITSRFSSARRHPILNYTRAHNGVDYAAPSGAPVASIAPGMVSLAGWTGGGGRTVRVRHSNGYESEYLHLSSIAVRAGQRVGQGELVGKVGATGLATGPHLHYGLRRNGGYVNPVVEHRNMPPGEPVPHAELASFHSERDRLFTLLKPARTLNANN